MILATIGFFLLFALSTSPMWLEQLESRRKLVKAIKEGADPYVIRGNERVDALAERNQGLLAMFVFLLLLAGFFGFIIDARQSTF